MQVADIILTDLSNIGGTKTGSRYRLAYFANNGYEVYSVSYYPSRNPYLPKSKRLHLIFLPKCLLRLPRYVGLGTITLLAYVSCVVVFLRVVKKVRLFHTHDIISAAACCLVRFFCNIKIAVTLHGPASYERLHFIEHVRFRAKILATFYSLLERFVYPRADEIMAVSEFERRFVSQVTPQRQVTIIRNGVDTNRFQPQRADLAETAGDKKKILFLARLVNKNGPHLVVQAIPKVIKRYNKCHFVFVGDGELRTYCEDFVARENLEKHVSFLGARRDVNSIMNSAHIFVSHVSSLVDGVGNNVLEALASGLPCIVGEDEISSTIFRNGVDALLVRKDDPNEIASAILKLLRNSKLSMQLSQNARRLALEKFSLKVQLKKVETILSNLSKSI
jgi:glycosyltransferase involved in cell wall biosynthesis